ncbi:MAG TPA: oxygenase MpaB family protein [Candidatus Limnocylindrales bacterium]|nr:oxygenase MpaB family protein [Candidatus Limnocylindrales bacterium]
MTSAAEAAGLFGPGSVSWRIDRELVVLAGGSCALLMQAAHPVVAAGVVEHSTFATDPFGRLMRTLESSFDVVFGSRSTAEAAIRRVNAIHRSVRGRMPDGITTYTALDPAALLWVHATLVDTALRVYGRFVAPLSTEEEQAYFEECGQVALMLGVPEGVLPARIGELRAWMTDRMDDGTIRVTPEARRIAQTVLYPIPAVPRVAWDAVHLISLSTLPAALRRQYGIGWSPARERGVERIARAMRSSLPLLPSAVRHAPRARAALRRMDQAVGTAR